MFDKLASYLDEHGNIESKIKAGLIWHGLYEIEQDYSLYKTAADEGDVAQAQIDAQRIQSNPVAQVAMQLLMKQPPPNLMEVGQLLTDKLIQDIRGAVETGPSVTDPLNAENKRLKIMVENLALKKQMRDLIQSDQQDQMMQMAGAAGMPPMGAPMPPQGPGAEGIHPAIAALAAGAEGGGPAPQEANGPTSEPAAPQEGGAAPVAQTLLAQ